MSTEVFRHYMNIVETAAQLAGLEKGTEPRYQAALYVDEFGDGGHWYVKGSPDTINRFVQLANSLEDEAVKGTDYEPGVGGMAKIHKQLGDDTVPNWKIVSADNLEQLEPIDDQTLTQLRRPDLKYGVQEFMSDFLWRLESDGQAVVHSDSEKGVAEGTKTLADYIAESERAYSQPVPGDYFAINIREETLFETWVCDETQDGIVIYADDQGLALLEHYGYLGEAIAEGHDFEIDSDGNSVDVVDQGEYDYEGDQARDQLQSIVRAARRLNGIINDEDNLPEWVQMKITKAEDYIDTAADYMQSNREPDMAEAKYQGREVPLGKPMKGDVKKSKVYVRGPKGNVVKVNFGQKGMKIKKNIPGRRKNFRARHNCDNPGPRHKARFWSCRAW